MGKAATPSTINVTNPATGESLGEVRAYTTDEAWKAVQRAKNAQRRWATVSVADRARIVDRFRDLLLDNARSMCELISRENGKVLQESLQMEVFSIVDLAAYFAARAPAILGQKSIKMHLLKHRRSYLHYRPRGVVLAIAPWNFPFAIPFGETIIALLAGNAVVLKPASLTPMACLEGRRLFIEAGLDPDLFQVIPCPGRVASELIDRGVDYVNFTGSTAVGLRVAELCGRKMTPCSMELGGKDPAIIMPDADPDVVIGSLVWGAFSNAGQVCASVERAYVHESLYDRIVEGVVEKTAALRVGNPLVDGTDMGAMTDPAQLAVVVGQMERAVAAGATVLTGGKQLDGAGQFYAPTVLVDVNDDMECVREETFGPTLPIMRYTDISDAVERANRSEYGLNAYVYTRDRVAGRGVAERLEAGTVMINECLITHAAPETPWSGVKMSGMGRVHSDDGMRDLCVARHVNEETLPTMKWSPFWQPYSHHMFDTLLGAARALYRSGVSGRATGASEAAKSVAAMLRGR